MKVRDTNLVVNVVVVGVVGADKLQRVPGEPVPAVVVDGLQRGNTKEEHGFASGKVRNPFRDPRTDSVKEEALEWVVVQSTERVRNVEPVVVGVELLVEEGVHMHRTVKEVLPGVDDEPTKLGG